MAIQMRRGLLANYDEAKMLAGEWGISIDDDTNDQKAFIAFAPGVSKEVMMVEDAQSQIAVATAEAIADATEEAQAWAHGNSFHVNDYASGNGSTKSFTLAQTPSSIIGVYVDGAAVTAYSRSGNVITFTNAPGAGQNNIRVYYTVNTSTDNAKYYKNQAASSASAASSSASSASSSASTATTKASEASSSASSAAASSAQAADSEAWAVGTKNGAAVPSSADQYHNNAKYWAEVAAASVLSSGFFIEVNNNEYVLYWFGADANCPYSIAIENGEYVLNLTYET